MPHSGERVKIVLNSKIWPVAFKWSVVFIKAGLEERQLPPGPIAGIVEFISSGSQVVIEPLRAKSKNAIAGHSRCRNSIAFQHAGLQTDTGHR